MQGRLGSALSLVARSRRFDGDRAHRRWRPHRHQVYRALPPRRAQAGDGAAIGDGILLSELYVDSLGLGDYVTPHLKVIRYGGVKAIKDSENPREDELPPEQAHEQLCRLEPRDKFEHNHIDLPSASREVSFVDLTAPPARTPIWSHWKVCI